MRAIAHTSHLPDAPGGPSQQMDAWAVDGWFVLNALGCPSACLPQPGQPAGAGLVDASAPPFALHLPLWEQPNLCWLHPDAAGLRQALEQGDAIKGALCQTQAVPASGPPAHPQVWMVHISPRPLALSGDHDAAHRQGGWLNISAHAGALAAHPAWRDAAGSVPLSASGAIRAASGGALTLSRPGNGVWTDPHRFQSTLEMETAASAQIGRGCALLVFRWIGPAADLSAPMDFAVHAVEAHLAAARRPSDTLSRTGVHEWSMLLTMLGSDAMVTAHDMHRMALRVMDAVSVDLAQHTGWESGPTFAKAGRLVVGITLIESHSEAATTALAQAQACLPSWVAPDGPQGVVFANAAIQERIHIHNTLTTELSRAIGLGELRLYFQPVVDIHADIVGAEALIRWINPTHGLIAPSRFIPLAEESGLIIPIGHWILRTACQQLVDWARIPYKAEWTIAVNISAQQFQRPDFVTDVLALLWETGANPRRLKLELTESLMMHDVEGAITTMKTLQTHGIKFSLDDFGTGYSSLSYLKRIPLDQVKIDQSFVRDLHTDANDAAIVKTILALAHSLELAVVAEGVETLEQEEFLVAAGCRYMQGYLYGRPAPIADWD